MMLRALLFAPMETTLRNKSIRVIIERYWQRAVHGNLAAHDSAHSSCLRVTGRRCCGLVLRPTAHCATSSSLTCRYNLRRRSSSSGSSLRPQKDERPFLRGNEKKPASRARVAWHMPRFGVLARSRRMHTRSHARAHSRHDDDPHPTRPHPTPPRNRLSARRVRAVESTPLVPGVPPMQ